MHSSYRHCCRICCRDIRGLPYACMRTSRACQGFQDLPGSRRTDNNRCVVQVSCVCPPPASCGGPLLGGGPPPPPPPPPSSRASRTNSNAGPPATAGSTREQLPAGWSMVPAPVPPPDDSNDAGPAQQQDQQGQQPTFPPPTSFMPTPSPYLPPPLPLLPLQHGVQILAHAGIGCPPSRFETLIQPCRLTENPLQHSQVMDRH
jgi:hypothetical protein